MSDSEPSTTQEKKVKKLPQKLIFIAAGMFAFGFAMVPLYQLVCQIGGVNGISSTKGRTLEAENNKPTVIDESRTLTVQFDSTINEDLPWTARPSVKTLKVHPGETGILSYFVTNHSDRTIIGQAVPGVTPWQATEYLSKVECFCFTQQTLKAGEAKEMALRFIIDPKLPEKYKTVTLSYTFMDTKQEPQVSIKDSNTLLKTTHNL